METKDLGAALNSNMVIITKGSTVTQINSPSSVTFPTSEKLIPLNPAPINSNVTNFNINFLSKLAEIDKDIHKFDSNTTMVTEPTSYDNSLAINSPLKPHLSNVAN